MHQYHFEFSAHMPDDRGEKLRYFGLTTVVDVLLLLNLLNIWKPVFGIDTAAVLAICITVIAVLAVGE